MNYFGKIKTVNQARKNIARKFRQLRSNWRLYRNTTNYSTKQACKIGISLDIREIRQLRGLLYELKY